MGISSSKNKYQVEEDNSFFEISKDEPYSDWLNYLKKWICVDSKKNKDIMLNEINLDLSSKNIQNYNDFINKYSSYENNLGSLAKCAFEVTKTNFMLWDMGIAPNIKA